MVKNNAYDKKISKHTSLNDTEKALGSPCAFH